MNQLAEKLSSIEKEIGELKLMIMQQNVSKTKISLKSSLKGVKLGEAEIEEAKKSLFKSGA